MKLKLMNMAAMALSALLCLTVSGAWAQNPSGSCGANLSWEFDSSNGTLTITGTGDMYDFDILENPAPWKSSRESITSVIIPNGVTSIGELAFENCSGLTGELVIPNSVISIGEQAFAYCTGLTSVTIGNSVTSIGVSAFNECSGLTSVTIGNSVTSIGVGAFFNCSGLTSITIPNSVTSIGMMAFFNCSGLTSVTNYAVTPQTINSNVFQGVDQSSCTLYVPAESVSAYSTASVWQDFGTKSAIPAPAPATYTVTLKSGTDDATSWQGKAGEGEYQALPLEGVAAGTAVTVKYNGTKKVKSVKAIKK